MPHPQRRLVSAQSQAAVWRRAESKRTQVTPLTSTFPLSSSARTAATSPSSLALSKLLVFSVFSGVSMWFACSFATLSRDPTQAFENAYDASHNRGTMQDNVMWTTHISICTKQCVCTPKKSHQARAAAAHTCSTDDIKA
jgi:hypothetical protein